MDVCAWVRGLGLERYADAFLKNGIDAELLAELTNEDLKDLGIARLADRKLLLKAIARLSEDATQGGNSDRFTASSEGERRQLTVMFCDLVGSTELAEQLDPEDMRGLLRTYQNACAEIVAQYDGYTAKYIGDGILIYFGYPLAHEDDPQRAVRAGLGITEEMDRVSQRDSRPYKTQLAVRVAVHTGLVVVGEVGGGDTREAHAIVGETPNIAARIEAMAKPGEVLVSGATHRLLGGAFACINLGSHSLKGVSDPVELFRVESESDILSRVDGAPTEILTPIVGRDEELNLLVRRWHQARDGEQQVVVLLSEAGIGKTRMIRAFRETLSDQPHNRILYFGSPYHQNSAFFPVIDQLQRALRFESDDDDQTKLDKLEHVLVDLGLSIVRFASPLAALLSLPIEGHHDTKAMGSDELRREINETLLAVVEAMANQAPTLIVVEDAQLIDPSTREYLDLLIEGNRNARVLLLLTFRPGPEMPWAGHARATILTLSHLSRKDCTAMVSDILDRKEVPKEVLEQIIANSDGVPLFVEELTKTVLESGLLTERDGRYALSGQMPAVAIPVTLQDSLMARLDRLGSTKELAQTAAVIGRSFQHELLAEISSLSSAQLDVALRVLDNSGLIYRRVRSGSAVYEFKHAMVQDVAYQSLLKTRRQQLHLSIAQAIETRFPEVALTQPELVARHYTIAQKPEKAIEFWQRAGEQAAQRSANIEATSHFQEALALLQQRPDTPDRARQEFAIQVAVGPALMMTKGIVAREVEQAYARARELSIHIDDPTERFKALWGHYFVFEIRGQWTDALKNTTELINLAKEETESGMMLQAHHAAWTANAMHGDLRRAQHHAELGWEAYDVRTHHEHKFLFGGHDPGVCSRSVGAMALLLMGQRTTSLEWLDRSLTLAKELDHPTTEMTAGFFGAAIHLVARDFASAAELAQSTIVLGTEYGNAAYTKMATILSGRILAAKDPSTDGIMRMCEVLERARSKRRGGFMQSFYLGLLADAYLQRGDHHAAAAALNDAFRMAEAQSECFWEAELYGLKGDLLLAQSTQNQIQAKEAYARAIDLAEAQGAGLLELRASTRLARLLGEQNLREEARATLEPICSRFAAEAEMADALDATKLLGELA